MKIEYSATDNTQSVRVAITARTQGSTYATGCNIQVIFPVKGG